MFNSVYFFFICRNKCILTLLFVIDFGKVYFDLFFNGLLINFLIFFC